MRAWLLAPAAVAGVTIGWGLHRPPPARVDTHETVRTEWRDREVEKRVEGPERVTTRTVTREIPRDVPGAERVTTVVQVVDRGPVTVERSVEATGAARVETKTLTVTLPPATWSLGLGAQLLPGTAVQLELGRRIVGPIWAEAWATQPLQLAVPAVGVGLRVEW